MGMRKIPISCDSGISVELLNFLDKCFKWEMKDRATADELLSHPFITRENLKKSYIIKRKEPIELSFDYELDYSEKL